MGYKYIYYNSFFIYITQRASPYCTVAHPVNSQCSRWPVRHWSWLHRISPHLLCHGHTGCQHLISHGHGDHPSLLRNDQEGGPCFCFAMVLVVYQFGAVVFCSAMMSLSIVSAWVISIFTMATRSFMVLFSASRSRTRLYSTNTAQACSHAMIQTCFRCMAYVHRHAMITAFVNNKKRKEWV